MGNLQAANYIRPEHSHWLPAAAVLSSRIYNRPAQLVLDQQEDAHRFGVAVSRRYAKL